MPDPIDSATLTAIDSPEQLTASPPRRGPGRPPGTGKKQQEAKAAAQAAAAVADSPELIEAREDLGEAYRGLWSTLAAMCDDAELEVNDLEVNEWARPAARTAEQFGLLKHTKKLAPAGLVGVTARQAKPRVKRILSSQVKKARPGQPGKPAPSFRPAGSTPPPAAPSSLPDVPPVNGYGSDKPIDITTLPR